MLDGMFTCEGRRSLGRGSPDVRCELIRNYGNINEKYSSTGLEGAMPATVPTSSWRHAGDQHF